MGSCRQGRQYPRPVKQAWAVVFRSVSAFSRVSSTAADEVTRAANGRNDGQRRSQSQDRRFRASSARYQLLSRHLQGHNGRWKNTQFLGAESAKKESSTSVGSRSAAPAARWEMSCLKQDRGHFLRTDRADRSPVGAGHKLPRLQNLFEIWIGRSNNSHLIGHDIPWTVDISFKSQPAEAPRPTLPLLQSNLFYAPTAP